MTGRPAQPWLGALGGFAVLESLLVLLLMIVSVDRHPASLGNGVFFMATSRTKAKNRNGTRLSDRQQDRTRSHTSLWLKLTPSPDRCLERYSVP
jgi:hypothetical protein